MKKPGYIIMLTLMIIAVAVALLSAVVQQSFTYQRQARTSFDRTRARMLALSSLELAASQVSLVMKKEKEAKEGQGKEGQGNGQAANGATEKKAKEALEPLQEWLLHVLPFLNRWQKLDLTASEGFDGSVALYISCEQGKINLVSAQEPPEAHSNHTGNQQAQPQPLNAETRNNSAQRSGLTQSPGAPQQPQSKRPPLAVIDELFKKEKGVSIQEALRKFQDDFQRMPEDASEFLRIKSFEKLKDTLFVSQEETKKPLFLMDTFTIRSEKEKLNPWLFTHSVKSLLGFKDAKDLKINSDLVKKMKPSMQWATDWDEIMAPIVGKKWAQLEPDLAGLFANEFEAKAFSVVSYCTVGNVTQKFYALLELTEVGQEFSPKSLIYKVTKLYWL